MKKVLLGSSNKSKIELYKHILFSHGLEVTTPKKENIVVQFEEDLFDIVGNSIKKASLYASTSGLPTISDDTGIFIPALGNQPGVAVRRWGGKLSDDISDEDWVDFFLDKISHLKGKQLDCYKHQVVSLAIPGGQYKYVEIKTNGTVTKSRNGQTYHQGGPLSAYFYLEEFNKVEAALTTKEREIFTKVLGQKVIKLINDFI